MAVDEPADVLQELSSLARCYVGPTPWHVASGSSNPIKLESVFPKEAVFAHSEPRNTLSAREGVALIYAFRAQETGIHAGATFSRSFAHEDGRVLTLENGVLRDLLALGVISHTSLKDQYLITGLGESEVKRRFPAIAPGARE